MPLSFVTTNPIKHTSPIRVLKEYGLTVEIVERDLPEIQAETAADVAIAKALEAFRLLGKAVVVNDFAIHFDLLGGFPGTFVKQATKKLGLDGFFTLLEGPEGLRPHVCRLVTAFAFMDRGLAAPAIFCRETFGRISDEAFAALPVKPKAKQLVMDIFVPEGERQAIGQMDPDAFDRWRKRPVHEQIYHDLAAFILARPRS